MVPVIPYLKSGKQDVTAFQLFSTNLIVQLEEVLRVYNYSVYFKL